MRASGGLRIRGWAARTGVPLPPPAGPARTEFCIVEGVRTLNTGLRKYGQALIGAAVHLPRGLADLPPKYPLYEQHSDLRSRQLGRARIQRWFGLRNRLDDLDDPARQLGNRYLGRDWAGPEGTARCALEAAVAAFNWLDDVAQDLDKRVPINVDSFSHATGLSGWGLIPTGTLLNQAHELAHLTGELVGGLFGCRLVHDGDEWTKRCPLSLMHIRLGLSPGMTVRYSCRICGHDPVECDHEFGKTYDVVAARTDDGCNICYAQVVASTPRGRSIPCALGGRSWKPIFTRSPSCRAHAIRLRVLRASTAGTTECVRVSALFRRRTVRRCATTVCIRALDSAAGTY